MSQEAPEQRHALQGEVGAERRRGHPGVAAAGAAPACRVKSLLNRVMRCREKLKLSGGEDIPEWLQRELPPPPRRERLPPPKQREKSVSLWSIIKECVGKDLSRVCLPVYFNEPLSSLQRIAEEMEYSELLDEVTLLSLFPVPACLPCDSVTTGTPQVAHTRSPSSPHVSSMGHCPMIAIHCCSSSSKVRRRGVCRS